MPQKARVFQVKEMLAVTVLVIPVAAHLLILRVEVAGLLPWAEIGALGEAVVMAAQALLGSTDRHTLAEAAAQLCKATLLTVVALVAQVEVGQEEHTGLVLEIMAQTVLTALQIQVVALVLLMVITRFPRIPDVLVALVLLLFVMLAQPKKALAAQW
jgi:hypothetical protein